MSVVAFTPDPLSLELAKYAGWASAKVKQGIKPRLPSGLSDVYNVFRKEGARSNASFLAYLRKIDLDMFGRASRRDLFDELCKLIVVNTDTRTRSFSNSGTTQKQIAKRLGVDQSTISRMLSDMVKAGLLRHAFIGNNDPRDPKAGIVCDKKGIPFNNIYYIEDAFALLAGSTAGNKLIQAFISKDKMETQKSGKGLYQRLLTLRNDIWENTIAKRAKAISDSSIAKRITSAITRSEKVRIAYARLEKRGGLSALTPSEVALQIHGFIKACHERVKRTDNDS
ncbi:MarR family transcriptional regulator [Photobacterium damselae subsp. damselae]|uniref:MarR family transcriptional regulator n=1 Tax=Photobacterium damselae TaxID=38293 RepID=UPI001F1D4EE5|nr:helix-turn-helix domain-containing protein [Photobacterium damselae]UJZ96360.1 MarR family transcriptional regulator [Photobacterium damselae subsp. damselae]UJZ99735.1 MarR family transcriptional regulator [Photobacterium damselae subsp. damselae]UKA12693.1 MarR family transcriptional regulator [Photobacterium damselae subsp. damselae]